MRRPLRPVVGRPQPPPPLHSLPHPTPPPHTPPPPPPPSAYRTCIRLSRAATARAAIGLAQRHFVLAIVGTIRRGKGVTQAVRFSKVRKEKEVLFISGQCADAELAADIQSAAGKDPRVYREQIPARC